MLAFAVQFWAARLALSLTHLLSNLSSFYCALRCNLILAISTWDKQNSTWPCVSVTWVETSYSQNQVFRQQQLTHSFTLPEGAIKLAFLCEIYLLVLSTSTKMAYIGSPWKVFTPITFDLYVFSDIHTLKTEHLSFMNSRHALYLAGVSECRSLSQPDTHIHRTSFLSVVLAQSRSY